MASERAEKYLFSLIASTNEPIVSHSFWRENKLYKIMEDGNLNDAFITSNEVSTRLKKAKCISREGTSLREYKLMKLNLRNLDERCNECVYFKKFGEECPIRAQIKAHSQQGSL